MSINFKAATLALTVASLFGAGQANAAACDGTVQTGFHGRTTQCYYLPTVSNGRVTGLQKEVNFRGYTNPYGGHSGGAIIGGGYPPVVRRPH
jgi:hypothetical protein